MPSESPPTGARLTIVLGADRAEVEATAIEHAANARVTALGDIDGDGFDDLATTSEKGVTLWQGAKSWPSVDNGSRTWRPAREEGSRISPAGDANCDGFDDVLLRTSAGLALYLGSRGGLGRTPAWSRYDIDDLAPLFAGPASGRAN